MKTTDRNTAESRRRRRDIADTLRRLDEARGNMIAPSHDTRGRETMTTRTDFSHLREQAREVARLAALAADLADRVAR